MSFFRAALTTLVLWTCLGFSVGGPLTESTAAVSLPMKFQKFPKFPKFVKSGADGSRSSSEKGGETRDADVLRRTHSVEPAGSVGAHFYRLPPSPANLLKPDEFQFYTYNERGDTITRQMTVQEIQALIAGGGPGHSTAEIQGPQKVEDILTGGKKVIDVVERVQSVLKSAMDKPLSTLSGPHLSIPEKVNVEWSNILPAILAGDKYGNKVAEEAPLKSTPASVLWNDSLVDSTKGNASETASPVVQEATSPAATLETATSSYTEKLMIPVAVVTTERNIEQVAQRTTPFYYVSKTTTAAPPFEYATNGRYNQSTEGASTATNVAEKSTTLFVESTEASVSVPTETERKPTLDDDHGHGHGHDVPLSNVETTALLEPDRAQSSDKEQTTRTTPLPRTTSAESSTVGYDTVTNASESLSTVRFKPLSVELVNSSSSTIDQVSALPAPSEYESTPSVDGSIDEDERNSSMDILAPENGTTTVQSANDTFGERIRDSSIATTVDQKIDEGHLSSAAPLSSVEDTAAKDTENSTNALTESTTSNVRLSSLDAVETTTPKSLDSLETSSNFSQSVKLIDSMLRTVSTGAVTTVTESLTLPNNLPDSFSANTLASALIAGFGEQIAADNDTTTTTTPPGSSLPAVSLEIHRPYNSGTIGDFTGEEATRKDSSTVPPVPSTHVESLQSQNDSSLLSETNSPTSSPLYVLVEDPFNAQNSTEQSLVSSNDTWTVASTELVSKFKEGKDETTAVSITRGTSPAPESASQQVPEKNDTNSTTQSAFAVANAPEAQVRPTDKEQQKDKVRVESFDSANYSNATMQSSDIGVTRFNDTTDRPRISTKGDVEESLANETSHSVEAITKATPAIDPSSSGESEADNNSTATRMTERTQSMQATEKLDVRESSTAQSETIGTGSTAIASHHVWQRISLQQTTLASPIRFPATSEEPEALRSTSTKTETNLQSNAVSPMDAASISTLAPDASKSTSGLDVSTRNASIDIVNFSRLCNELAMKFWIAANKGLSAGRSLVLSPFGTISLLAMIFLGARGSTSDQMNEILGLDNVATFNPHLVFQNVTDTVSLARNQGIANAAFVRELFADKGKVRKLLPFYKEQAQQFYEGLVAEVNFATISDLVRRRTNLLVRKQTGGRTKDFVKSNTVALRSPLAAISANVFQIDCNTSSASAAGRDGELYFAVSPAHRSRKLIPVPATVWRSNVLAGYEPSLDATAVALGGVDRLVSTIFLLPGQQGHLAPGDTLDRLEQRLVKGAFQDGTWNKLLKVLVPRPGLDAQIPKFTHRSVVNATAALKGMGLDQLFSSHADLKGINGIGNRLFLSDVLQMNLFSTCADENVANGRHHVEIYPAGHSQRNDARSKRYFADPTKKPTTLAGRAEERAKLKLDQPFLYFVRHNPTGLILHMGRFNPRVL